MCQALVRPLWSQRQVRVEVLRGAEVENRRVGGHKQSRTAEDAAVEGLPDV